MRAPLGGRQVRRQRHRELDAPFELLKQAAQAVAARNAVVKALYTQLFGWLVSRVNSSLRGGATPSMPYIGLLDVFGFEIFETNSFEQLCINFANEKLQQHFIVHTFEQEQELYRHEGIQWKTIGAHQSH